LPEEIVVPTINIKPPLVSSEFFPMFCGSPQPQFNKTPPPKLPAVPLPLGNGLPTMTANNIRRVIEKKCFNTTINKFFRRKDV